MQRRRVAGADDPSPRRPSCRSVMGQGGSAWSASRGGDWLAGAGRSRRIGSERSWRGNSAPSSSVPRRSYLWRTCRAWPLARPPPRIYPPAFRGAARSRADPPRPLLQRCASAPRPRAPTPAAHRRSSAAVHFKRHAHTGRFDRPAAHPRARNERFAGRCAAHAMAMLPTIRCPSHPRVQSRTRPVVEDGEVLSDTDRRSISRVRPVPLATSTKAPPADAGAASPGPTVATEIWKGSHGGTEARRALREPGTQRAKGVRNGACIGKARSGIGPEPYGPRCSG